MLAISTVPAPAALTVALIQLLYLDGRTMPDSPDRAALLAYVGGVPGLKIGHLLRLKQPR